MKKNIIIVTGGAGFVGSHLIERLLKIKKYRIISILWIYFKKKDCMILLQNNNLWYWDLVSL